MYARSQRTHKFISWLSVFGWFMNQTHRRKIMLVTFTVLGLYSTFRLIVSIQGIDHYYKAGKPLECEARKRNVLSASWISRAICRTWFLLFSLWRQLWPTLAHWLPEGTLIACRICGRKIEVSIWWRYRFIYVGVLCQILLLFKGTTDFNI